MKKIKILYFIDRMKKGGIQTLAVEIAKNIDKEKFQIDFLLLDDGNKYALEETLENLGCNIYKLKGVWINKPTDFIKYRKSLNDFYKKHNDYKVIHLHSTSKNYIILKYAKRYGIKTRIAHSHAIDFQTTNFIKKIIGNAFKIMLSHYATDFFACSDSSGKWLFGKNKDIKIIHNAVDLDKFNFSEESRNNIRTSLRINKETFVIGNVGRFIEIKNHDFLIDIFNEIHKQRENSVLLLVGDGETEQLIKNKVKKLNLQECVIFAGSQENVSEYMSAMDIFVFPSKSEGLGLVLIEAQANGMRCFTTDKVVSKEAQVSNLLTYINLDAGAKNWADEILNSNIERLDKKEEIKAKNYDIKDVVKFLENYYEK